MTTNRKPTHDPLVFVLTALLLSVAVWASAVKPHRQQRAPQGQTAPHSTTDGTRHQASR